MAAPFWERKSLAEMTDAEWESLCDGCGQCCMVLLIDDEDNSVWETTVACDLYDCGKRRCTDYANRHVRTPDCVRLTPENAGALEWMPETCAYRRLARGQNLPDWHPLRTGDPASTAAAGVATPPRLVREAEVPEEEIWDHAVVQRLPGRNGDDPA